jgi:hypothetical protein
MGFNEQGKSVNKVNKVRKAETVGGGVRSDRDDALLVLSGCRLLQCSCSEDKKLGRRD